MQVERMVYMTGFKPQSAAEVHEMLQSFARMIQKKMIKSQERRFLRLLVALGEVPKKKRSEVIEELNDFLTNLVGEKRSSILKTLPAQEAQGLIVLRELKRQANPKTFRRLRKFIVENGLKSPLAKITVQCL